MKFSIAQGSRQGPRTYNQDRLAYTYNRQAILMVLADGMGGHLHGEVAAEIVVKGMIEAFQREATPLIQHPAQFLRTHVSQLHTVIERVRQQKNLSESPRTTVVVALCQHNLLFCAHVGDSRCYLYRNGAVAYQTQDHSVVQSLLRDGKISPADVDTHPHRNKIYNCVGGERPPEVELSDPIAMVEGDVVVLCSDGVWNAIAEPTLAQHTLAAEVSDTVQRLLDDAEAASARVGDNMSIVALQWGDRRQARFTISSLDLPMEGTTTMMNQVGSQVDAPALDLTDAEIERAIAEIHEALGKTKQFIKSP